ncbi:HEXXH motif domain-containing protein [Streptomyces sp. NPDC059076]|uniref:HEXXH motif domain-containing protein n=1 Tax=unclassified Streptomyces TaxID=2593676 RepID=UPI0036B7718F
MNPPHTPHEPAPPHHRLDGAVFHEIASGNGGPRALSLLRNAEYSRRVVLARAVVEQAELRGGTLAAQARDAWSLLGAAHRRAPAVVHEVLTYPSVGPAQLWALNQLMTDRSTAGPPPSLDALTAVAAAAAVRTGLPAAVRLTVHSGGLLLPSLGRARFPLASDGEPALVSTTSGSPTVQCGATMVRIPRERSDHALSHEDAGTPWLALRALLAPADGPALLLDDLDPHLLPGGGHPGRLTACQWQRWRCVFEEAWQLLHTVHPEQAVEARSAYRAIVPTGAPTDRNISSSSDEAFGCSVLSVPRSPLDLALALVHELQHNKLSALTHLVDLVVRESGVLFYAPWREDPRPPGGLLHGVYAHMGVAQFWRRQRRASLDRATAWRAVVEFARWRDAAKEANETLLAGGCLTEAGRRFAEQMRSTLAELAREPVPRAAMARAKELGDEHRDRWLLDHGARW